MPIVTVHILEGRSKEQKRTLIRKVTEAVVEALDAPPDTVRVIVTDMLKDAYGIGGHTAEDLGR